jgi:DNA-directed RNA polymerase III subunit RPC1
VKNNPDMLQIVKNKYDAASIFYKDLDGSLNKIAEELTSQKVHNLFLKIPKDEFIFFDMNYQHTRPIDLLIHYVIVPPLSIRPTVPVGYNVTNEDDLTIKIGEILYLDKLIKTAIAEGHNTSKMIEDISLLQHTHAQYINSDTKGLNKNILGNKPIRSLCTRLKGKQGRFRGNLSGKRVDFTGRTVISPDPNLRIDQVGVPLLMAKTLTYPQRVNCHNISEMRKLVLNGPEVHPGANFVELANGNKIYLAYTSRKKIAEELKIGDIIERHLMDNDIILFNRQPSLHRLSIMAFRAKVLPWRTLRFNECVCTPFNADFDGDEMNIHLPQTEEARSEALYLMGVKENLITPKNAEPLVAATQDFLTTFFLITQKDYFLDRSHFFKYLSYFNDSNEKIEIPPPCIMKPIELWSGKQIFSILLRPNRKSKVIVNLEVKAKNFSKAFKKDEFRCLNDGYVVIKNSELLTGNIDKTSIGGSSKTGVVFTLIKDNNKV